MPLADPDKENKGIVNKDLFRRKLLKGDSVLGAGPFPRSSPGPDEKPGAPPANPQHVPEFRPAIREYLRRREPQFRVDPDYLRGQADLTERMRSILVDWLVDVNLKFNLRPATLFLTVNLVDRFLARESINRHQVQLAGVAALMIVAKFEEIYPPLLKEYVGVCDNAYTREQILDMESRILLAVDFDLAQTPAYAFLAQMQLDLGFDQRAFCFGQYVAESALFDPSLLKYSNHDIAAGAAFLVCKVFKKDDWKRDFEGKVGVPERLAKNCAKDLFRAMQLQDKSSLAALKRKFAAPQFFEMSKYRVEKISSSGC